MRACSGCGETKPLDAYNKKVNAKDGRQPWCRECNRARSRRYYAENKEKHRGVIKAQKAKTKARNRKIVADYLAEHPCVDCGNTDMRVLEFDHTGELPKEADVAKMIQNCYTPDRMIAEIAKCEVRCCNCHRLKTFERNPSWRSAYDPL